MGYDISGFTKYNEKEKEPSNEVAYVRRGAFNELARVIYQALDAEQYDCGCSGCGDTVFFTTETLKLALTKIPEGEDFDVERKFLNDCIANGKKGIWIVFY